MNQVPLSSLLPFSTAVVTIALQYTSAKFSLTALTTACRSCVTVWTSSTAGVCKLSSLAVSCSLVLCRLRDVAGFLADRKYHLSTYKRCFVGNEFVDWLVANGEVSEREEGVELGRQLLESGTIHHGQ